MPSRHARGRKGQEQSIKTKYREIKENAFYFVVVHFISKLLSVLFLDKANEMTNRKVFRDPIANTILYNNWDGMEFIVINSCSLCIFD